VAICGGDATGTSVRILIGAPVSGLTAAVTGLALITRRSVIQMIKEPADNPEE
jgi:hypothetical protein